MNGGTWAAEVLDETFEELTLVLGGVFDVHAIEDEVIWQVVRSLDAIRAKALARLADRSEEVSPPRRPPGMPHPAIEEFLRTLRKEQEREREP